MPIGSKMRATDPSPSTVEPAKASMPLMWARSGFTTISSVETTSSTTNPKFRPWAWMTTMNPADS